MAGWRDVLSTEGLAAWLRRLLGTPDAEVEIGHVTPALLAVRARGVRIAVPLRRGASATEVLAIDELVVRPSWALLGLHVTARLYGGVADVHAGMLGHHHRVRLRIERLRLERSPLTATTGLALEGGLSVSADLAIEGREPATLGGRLELGVAGLRSSGGTLGGTALPVADLGDLGISSHATAGVLTVRGATARSPDLDTELGGELALAHRLASSALHLRLRVRPTAAFGAREPAAAGALASAAPVDAEGYHAFDVGPSLGHAAVRPAGSARS